jgi:hypothetical protein
MTDFTGVPGVVQKFTLAVATEGLGGGMETEIFDKPSNPTSLQLPNIIRPMHERDNLKNVFFNPLIKPYIRILGCNRYTDLVTGG